MGQIVININTIIMTIFTIFIVLSYLLFTNPFVKFTTSEDSVFIVLKTTSSEIQEEDYIEYAKVRTYKLFKFR